MTKKQIKKITWIATVLAVIVVSSYIGQRFMHKASMSDIMPANVEALASFEWNESRRYCWRCSYGAGSDFFFTYIRCFDCNVSTAVSVQTQEQCWHIYESVLQTS